jgi:uncharacterized protein YjiS (DUF1127 family)
MAFERTAMNTPDRLDTHIPLASAPASNRPGAIFAALWREAFAVMRRGHAKWAQRRHARITYIALREMDARTLHDLGLDFSELTSVAAETSGTAELTRAHSAHFHRASH